MGESEEGRGVRRVGESDEGRGVRRVGESEEGRRCTAKIELKLGVKHHQITLANNLL